MLTMNLQLFAHKKGTGSSHNGRDSESKRLGAKRADGQFVLAGNSWCVSAAPTSIPASTWASARMTPCLPRKTASCASSAWAATRRSAACTLSHSKG